MPRIHVPPERMGELESWRRPSIFPHYGSHDIETASGNAYVGSVRPGWDLRVLPPTSDDEDELQVHDAVSDTTDEEDRRQVLSAIWSDNGTLGLR